MSKSRAVLSTDAILRAADRMVAASDVIHASVERLLARLDSEAPAPSAAPSATPEHATPNRSRAVANARRARAVSLYTSGMPIHKIADELGATMWVVRDDLRKNGINHLPRVHKRCALRRDKVMEMYDMKLGTPAEIAEALGISTATVIDDIGVRLAERALAPGAAT